MRGPITDKPRTRPTVPEVVALARKYYEHPNNLCGGNLHIVLDDRNLADHHIEACRQMAAAEADEAGVQLADMLLAMTPTQRRRVHALV